MRLQILSVLATTTAIFACSPTRYSYSPVTTTTTTSAVLEGALAADYPIPAGSPQGEVRLAMLGVPNLVAGATTSSPSVRAIHVAISVVNRSAETWTVDPSEQRATLTAHRQRSDVYATTPEIARPEAVDIPAGSSRVVDLYFPLPIQWQSEKETDLPSFDVTWVVHAGSRVIATQSTPFQRFIVDTAPPPPPRPPDVYVPAPEIEQALPGTQLPDRRRPWLPVEPIP